MKMDAEETFKKAKRKKIFVTKISVIRAFILYMKHVKRTCTHQVISIQKLDQAQLIL